MLKPYTTKTHATTKHKKQLISVLKLKERTVTEAKENNVGIKQF